MKFVGALRNGFQTRVNTEYKNDTQSSKAPCQERSTSWQKSLKKRRLQNKEICTS